MEELNDIVEIIIVLEQESNVPYDENVQLWTQLVVDEKIKDLRNRLQKSQWVEDKLRDILATLSLVEKINTIKDYEAQQQEIFDLKEEHKKRTR